MNTAFAIAAVCILVTGLFAVIVERTSERDKATRENRDLRATVARLEAENAALEQDNMRMASRLADIEPLDRPHLYVVDTPLHDDLAVETLRDELDEAFIEKMRGWGNEAGA